MYKHVLIPTDGSDLSEKAAKAGIEFARSLGAKVTAFTAMPEYPILGQGEVMAHKRVVSLQEYEERAGRQAEGILARIAERAAAAGVECGSDYALSDRPHEAIIDAANKNGCDLIFMASHGRRGFSAFVHGSETQGVLTHSKIPTLVYR